MFDGSLPTRTKIRCSMVNLVAQRITKAYKGSMVFGATPICPFIRIGPSIKPFFVARHCCYSPWNHVPVSYMFTEYLNTFTTPTSSFESKTLSILKVPILNKLLFKFETISGFVVLNWSRQQTVSILKLSKGQSQFKPCLWLQHVCTLSWPIFFRGLKPPFHSWKSCLQAEQGDANGPG